MDLLNLFVKIGVKDEASAAVDDVSGNIIGKLASAAKTAAKALAGMWAVKKVFDFGKAAFDAYSSFEQLQGGVAKLYGNANMELDEYIDSMKSSGKSVDELTKTYQRNEKAQELMMQQASEAWRTAGVDANTYMEQATSMSAALINSLGGDTVEAAKQTDVAMRAISDNVNTFGTDMESVSQAFMGFSKQNYTMLDNLKLGYGGTKTEMERLIADANEWGAANGKASDLSIDSFSDVVTAIEQIQEKQGIAGTTAREAMSTIEGSMNATKAAWQNLVTEFGKPDADIGARVSDLVDGIFGIVDDKTGQREGGLFKNVTAEVGTIATNMVNAVGQGVQAGFDWLTQNGPQMVSNALDSIEQTILGAVDGLQGLLMNSNPLESLFSNASGIADKVTSFVSGIASTIQEKWPEIQSAAEVLFDKFVGVVTTYGPTILSKLGSVLGNIGNAILEHGPELVGASVEMFGKLAENITSKGPELVQKVISIAETIVFAARDWLYANGPSIIEAVRQTLVNVLTAIYEHGPEILSNIAETIGNVIGYVLDAGPRLLAAAIEFMGGLITGTSQEGEALRSWFSEFFPDGLLKGLGDFATFLLDAGKSLIDGLLKGIGKAAPNVEKAIRTAFDSVIGFFQGIADFIADPMGSIEDFVASLTGTSDEAAASVDSSMQAVAGSTAEAADKVAAYNATELSDKTAKANVAGNVQDGSGKQSLQNYNSVKLGDKNAKATVTGNAQDGKAKTSVENTGKAVKNLSGKSITVSAGGNVINGVAESAIRSTKSIIDKLKDKAITVTTHQKTTGSGPTKAEQARGGIRRHARGDIMVANRYTEGVPLDIVGEAGPEAIVPLTSRYGHEFARIMGTEAGKYIGGHMGGGTSYNLYYSGEQSALDIFDDLTFRMQVLEAMGD